MNDREEHMGSTDEPDALTRGSQRDTVIGERPGDLARGIPGRALLGEQAVRLDEDWRHAVDWTECVREGHLPVVTSSWWFGTRHWLRCWRCDLKLGPWRGRDAANVARQVFDEAAPSRRAYAKKVGER